MAMYVYKDKERTIEFYAQDALRKDIGIRYYCPNPDCNAHMYLCSVDGSSTAYFSANRQGFSHIEDCEFGSSNSFNPNKTDESAFDFQQALQNMLNPSLSTKKKKVPDTHKTGEFNLKPLSTLRQIYDMCKSFACNQSYNNQVIGQILLDSRSEYMYLRGVFGSRIIEANKKTGNCYSAQKSEIYLVAPKSKKYEFVLKFSDDELFRFFRDSIYNNYNKLIVVAGNWGSSGKFNVFQTNITSKNQIKVMQ